ncbi:MAG: carbohydrate ABC transporter permease [Eubacterium sp.]|nr:carbohydrate ABC transporter permease [Eubacterium sp.]
MQAESKFKHNLNTFLRYFVLVLVGLIMIYPLLWMIGATFKSNADIFSGIGLFTSNPTLEGYQAAMTNYGGDINILRAMINTFSYVIPKVVFTVISVTLTAYGFGRFEFKGRAFLFSVLMATLFLPQVVLNVPQYLLFSKLNWVGSSWYLPIIVPTLCAIDTTFVFQMTQFLRGVPRDLDEAAKIDGCTALQTLVKVIVPMLMPSITSVALFQFMWSSNDFMGPLLYVNSPAKYPMALFVKMSMDADAGTSWNRILAMSLISMIPSLIVFFLAQDQFVEGISAGGVKG